ncbi:hypothetical protein TL16_g11155 [Triparma laevis f. inornata]|uniref:Uncharacterized protein n=1 Tax=Triparma laevis f. inornata TaxID=1714386 RepID=A0A9W7ESN5_9STRA|nr:hypothetical protein TL16_g11155 [Triparma laevis f. inornata]
MNSSQYVIHTGISEHFEGSTHNDLQHSTLMDLSAAAIKAKGWSAAEEGDIEELDLQLDCVIANSTDVEGAVEAWYNMSWPVQWMDEEAKENQKLFFIRVAKRHRVARKMGRWGVGIKLFITLVIGYADIVTDFLVAKSYYDVQEFSTAYTTAGFGILAILIQAFLTFFQYANKKWYERLGRTILALMGLGPLVEGAGVWTGKENFDTLFSGPFMYAALKAIEISFESVPESIIQVGGILKSNKGGVQMIQIIGVISSILSGAFIMTDGNFGMNLSKYLASPGDPYYGWISKKGGWELARQLFGMFVFNACYFAQFVFAMSLFSLAFKSVLPLFMLLGVEVFIMCAYIFWWKGELFGYAMAGHPSPASNYFIPITGYIFYYILACAVPLLITAAPCELGAEVFASILIWRLLTSGGVIYIALGELGEDHWLSITNGMIGYGISLALAAVGLTMFLMNCDKNFDRSLFWRPKSGREHERDFWRDPKCWKRKSTSKEEERWQVLRKRHPLYLPFDEITLWVCEHLVELYEDRRAPRPDWMAAGEKEKAFVKRIVTLYKWKGTDEEEVNKALGKLFGKSGNDLEIGPNRQLTFIKKRRFTLQHLGSTLARLNVNEKVGPEEEKANERRAYSGRG